MAAGDEAGIADHLKGTAGEMASAGNARPNAVQPILPAAATATRGSLLLDEQQTPIGLEHAAANLRSGHRRIALSPQEG